MVYFSMMEVLPTPVSPKNTILYFSAFRFDFDVKLIKFIILSFHRSSSRFFMLFKFFSQLLFISNCAYWFINNSARQLWVLDFALVHFLFFLLLLRDFLPHFWHFFLVILEFFPSLLFIFLNWFFLPLLLHFHFLFLLFCYFLFFVLFLLFFFLAFLPFGNNFFLCLRFVILILIWFLWNTWNRNFLFRFSLKVDDHVFSNPHT